MIPLRYYIPKYKFLGIKISSYKSESEKIKNREEEEKMWEEAPSLGV